MYAKRIMTTFAVALVMVAACFTTHAESAEEKGLAIYGEVDARDIGWKNNSVDLKMLLKNRHGQTSTRELSMQIFETNEPGLGDKSLTVFSSPRDVNGTAFLSHTKITDPDDQWLFLPALKRVKRISSSNKSGPFMGSEFAFEDLSSQELGKYTYKYIKDESEEGLDCFVVERYPVYKNSGYTRQLTWIDKAEYRPIKIEYYDRKNTLLKTLVFSDYNQHKGKYWRANTMTMENQQTGKSTVLTYANYDFDSEISESTFTSARLKTIR